MIQILLLSLAQIATPHYERPDELRSRVQASMERGLGGYRAEYALCQLHAVIEFYDGSLTPDVMPDAAVWEEFAYKKHAERPALPVLSADAIAVFRRELARIEERYEAFKKHTVELGWLVSEGPDHEKARRNTKEYSNVTGVEIRVIAESGLSNIRSTLTGRDLAEFERWMAQQKRQTSTLSLDHHRIEDYGCD